MSINQRPSMDVALLAGRVPYQKRLFVVGPFAERVSFASQQRRALSLVFAIDDELKRGGDSYGLAGKNVCVVGAGLAGLTCSVALAAFDSNSWVLERCKILFENMKGAKHREVHPSINFWPGEIVGATTELPFFNWFQDRCDLILERIEHQWNDFEEDFPQIKGITFDCTVTGLSWKNGWKIKTKGNSPPIDAFDIVILASGFGAENIVKNSGTPSYWNVAHDRVDVIREARTPPVDNFVVSGTGDGGLIEVLRLLYRRFQAGSIGPGTAPILRDLSIQHELKRAEGLARTRVSDDLLHKPPLSDKTKDDVAKDLWEAYDGIYRYLGANFRKALENERTSVRKVILLGERAAPTEYRAAPYHRLLIMQAIREGYLEYHQISGDLEVEMCRKSPSLYPDANRLDIPRHRISFQSIRQFRGVNRTCVIEDKIEQKSLDCCFFLGRHGTTSPLKTIFAKAPPETVDFIRTRQALYADQDWISMDQASAINDRLGLADPDTPWRRVLAYLDEARDFFKRYGLRVEDVAGDGCTAEFVLVTNGSDPRWNNPAEREELPASFYGIKVNTDSILRMRASGRSGFR